MSKPTDSGANPHGFGLLILPENPCVYLSRIYAKPIKVTTVFKSGNSLCVRLPKGFSLPLGKVEIHKDEKGIHLSALENDWPTNLAEIFPSENPATEDWKRPSQGELPTITQW